MRTSTPISGQLASSRPSLRTLQRSTSTSSPRNVRRRPRSAERARRSYERARSSSAVSSAVGRNSRRSSGIGSPLSLERPYVPPPSLPSPPPPPPTSPPNPPPTPPP